MGKYKNFYSPDEVIRWVKGHVPKQFRHYDWKRDPDRLRDYKEWASTIINSSLRHGAESYNRLHIEKLQNRILSSEIDENIVVFRYVSPLELLALLKGTLFGKTYTYKGFLSTTLLKDDYEIQDIKRFRIPIRLLVPVGTKGMYVPDINPKVHEYEILFPYNCTLSRREGSTFLLVSV